MDADYLPWAALPAPAFDFDLRNVIPRDPAPADQRPELHALRGKQRDTEHAIDRVEDAREQDRGDQCEQRRAVTQTQVARARERKQANSDNYERHCPNATEVFATLTLTEGYAGLYHAVLPFLGFLSVGDIEELREQ
ncbi:hypothetical protein [Streptomyces sp. NBC_01763]|uniref:hypothetical protein n=1 Tax=Streptomyces sp. NBC_01763 TaxID=2975934 RepID=UPI002DD837CE|nr:hypothetical protein [Streptomyces sp. NBC_01763]WSC35586.1 hypothetical protein OHA08_08790 [Streptomyces sp. NBC_01763]